MGIVVGQHRALLRPPALTAEGGVAAPMSQVEPAFSRTKQDFRRGLYKNEKKWHFMDAPLGDYTDKLYRAQACGINTLQRTGGGSLTNRSSLRGPRPHGMMRWEAPGHVQTGQPVLYIKYTAYGARGGRPRPRGGAGLCIQSETDGAGFESKFRRGRGGVISSITFFPFFFFFSVSCFLIFFLSYFLPPDAGARVNPTMVPFLTLTIKIRGGFIQADGRFNCQRGEMRDPGICCAEAGPTTGWITATTRTTRKNESARVWRSSAAFRIKGW